MWLAAVAAALLAMAARSGGPLPGDLVILHLLQALPSQPVHVVALVTLEPVIGGLAIVLAWALRRHLPPWRFLALMAGAPIVERLVKFLVHRPRPAGSEEGWAFPSGHALFTMTLAVLIVGTIWPDFPRRGRRWLVSLAVAGVILVAADRVALGVHWPSDVLGGWLIGLAYGVAGLPWAVGARGPNVRSRGGTDAWRDIPETLQR